MPDFSINSEDALHVLKRLRSAGFEAYFAGGCVRDLLLGLQAKDYDIATNAEPEQVRRLFNNTQAVGAAFGVILVRERKSTIEVATFRTDVDYQDGRHPTEIKFSTAKEDAQRRDFTINGLFLDPIENRIIDYVDGQADLKAKVIRAIGKADERFAEDHLRMLRAIRFASKLSFGIEPTTSGAIKSHGHELIRISPERIAEELRKMLMPVTRDRAFELLLDFGFVQMMMRALPEKPDTPYDARTTFFLALTRDQSISFGLALAAIVVDFRTHASGRHDPVFWLSAPQVKRSVNAMRQTLKISNDEAGQMAGSLAWGQLVQEHEPTVAAMKRFLQQPHSTDAMLLMDAVQRCGLMVERLTSMLSSLRELRATDYAPPPLIKGDDLTAAGAVPGPKFKSALDAAYDAQLEGTIDTRTQAMDLALRQLGIPISQRLKSSE